MSLSSRVFTRTFTRTANLGAGGARTKAWQVQRDLRRYTRELAWGKGSGSEEKAAVVVEEPLRRSRKSGQDEEAPKRSSRTRDSRERSSNDTYSPPRRRLGYREQDPPETGAFSRISTRGRSSVLRPSKEFFNEGELPPGVFYTRPPKKDIPKTKEGSEFIYGTSVVEAALTAGKRELLKFYVSVTAGREEKTKERDARLIGLAKKAGVQVVPVKDTAELDAMAQSRPHNGYVLECMPLTVIPVLSLSTVNPTRSGFLIKKAQHTTKPNVILNNLPNGISSRDDKRYPFVLMLDEILDPANLGAILRSAYFLGVDAVCVSALNCAGFTATTLKASSGAAEFLPLFETNSTVKFLESSAEAGWKVYATEAPKRNPSPRDLSISNLGRPLRKHPAILVLGNEGYGLRNSVLQAANYTVGIPGAKRHRLVESMNVSAATAVLCERFLLDGNEDGEEKAALW